ncbi:hypothetical protein Tco_1127807 [Tanacetum coccineum]
MSNMSEDIQYAGSDTRPPMLDRTDFESWQQRIRLYCLGKDNGENIMKSITEGPFQMGTMRDTLTEGGEGALHLGPERARVFADLSAEQKDRYKADIRATNILLQGIPKDIYTLINHFTDAKDIWDNVKMILEGSELTKDDRESQLYDENEHFYQIKRTAELWLRCPCGDTLANNQGKRDIQRNNARGNVVAGNVGGEQVSSLMMMWNFDEDVDNSPENDLALNVDHVFEADECDAFVSNVDEGPTTQTMFMTNLTSKDRIYDEAGPSSDSNTPFKVQNHDTFVNHLDEYHEVHKMQTYEQHNYVVDSDADYMSDSNIILYDQYMEDNEDHVVQSNVSSVRNDALMSILDEMHEQGVQSRLANKPDMIVNDSVTTELARYKELVGEYEKRANSTVGHYKSKTEEVIISKKDFKQKEDKFLEEFLDIKRLKDKIEDRLYKQDQSVQTVHMLCKPKLFYDEKNKVAIGYKNPLCLTRAKQTQSALYNGRVLVTTNHTPTVIHNSEDMREIAEITRKRMLLKMQSPLCVENKVRIAPPPDYSKENLLATFAPQRNLTPKQIFWSIDDNNRKKAETSVPKPISALIVYPPNTPVKLVPKILPTKSQVKINLYVLTQLFTEFDKTCKTIITPTGVTEGEREVKVMEEIFDQMNNEVDTNAVDKQCAKIVKKNLLIKNENLIANWLSNQLLYDVGKSRCLDLEAEMSKIEDLKAQLEGNLKVATRSSVKIKVLAPGMYAIDVKPIPHPLKNNKSAHLTYINHLKESVETVREIVEEARVVKPLDNALNYACQYTKLSQELLEYVIGIVQNSFNERDNKAPSTPVTRKKQVTFNDKPGTSSSNTQKHEVHQKVQQTNVPVIHSTRVNTSTEASGSKPRSNPKKNRIMPAKTENKKKVEDHPRINKSVWTKVNRVDSSISSKRVFMGTVRFGNDHFEAIMGYGDYVIGDSAISRVYYVEGLRHNLFSVGQFCDSDLEVAFRKHSCFVRDIKS